MVFVERLIVQNSVEAGIRPLQGRNQVLADAPFVGTDRGPLGLMERNMNGVLEPR